MKKLLILMLFLNSPIFGMDVWTKIKRWITENPSGTPAVKTTALPALPSDVQTMEIVKQLLNVSSNRDQALTLLSNYAQVNKAIGNYVKNNKVELQKLLDEKFGLSLIELASGDYDNPQIKTESRRILGHFILADSFKYDEWKAYIFDVAEYIKTGQGNLATPPLGEIKALSKILRLSYLDKFKVAAVLLGVLNYTFNNNKAVFGEDEENGFVDLLKDFIRHMCTDKNYTQMAKLIINTAVKIFGPQFINKKVGTYFPQTGTLLNQVRNSKNQEAIKYLETINKLNR